jgi:hypothetical protein
MQDGSDHEKISIKTYSSPQEIDARQDLSELLRGCPIPQDQLLANLGLFLTSKDLARILFMDFLFRQIVDVQGVVIEFGTRWGQNMALFSALRGIYDPFNRHRKIIGFDTFEGFPQISDQDGTSDLMREGQLAMTPGYDKYLDRVLTDQELLNPLSHLKKFDIRVGDATVEFPQYLLDVPETIIALVYFDFDLYEPTKQCLEQIRPRLTKGSIVAFDELNDPDSPGETLALMETFGLPNVELKRYPHVSRTSYFVIR